MDWKVNLEKTDRLVFKGFREILGNKEKTEIQDLRLV